MTDEVTLYHSPNTRSSGVLALMEELEVKFDLKVLNMKSGENRQPEYLAINPMGKVPAVVHRGQVVTEQVAIFIFLADLYPQAGLAPKLEDPLRAPYLRFLAFYGSCFEPAVLDRAMKREPGNPAASPYGSYDATLATLTDRLRAGPYILGETFSAADMLWGSALRFFTRFKLVPELPEIAGYVERVCSRPSFARAQARDEALVAAQG